MQLTIKQIRSRSEGLKTGCKQLDDRAVRLRPEQLAVLGARLGHGKTLALLNLAVHALSETEGQIVFLSLDPPTRDFSETARYLAPPTKSER